MRTRPARRPPQEKAAARDRRDNLADRTEERLAIPVIIAAAVSVPAVFLSVLTSGTSAQVGTALNWASLAVLTAESVLLFLLAGHRLAWIRRHWWKLAILLIAVPAMIFLAAPAQAMRFVIRLVQVVGAIRVLRAGRIIKAGRVLARRMGWEGRWRYAPILVGSVIAAIFVGVVLSDPTSTTRDVLADLTGWPELLLVMLAGAILAAATFIVVRYRRGNDGAGTGEPEPATAGAGGEKGCGEEGCGEEGEVPVPRSGGGAGGADHRGEPVGGGAGDLRGGRLHHHPDQ